MLILIVDDDSATATFMHLAFTAAGHAVTTASSVDEAVRCATGEPPDVVLSDLTFGGVLDGERDGCSLARALRTIPATADAGLLAVSGACSPYVLRETIDSGFDGFVSKPVDLTMLLERVDRLGELVDARRSGARPTDRPGSTSW